MGITKNKQRDVQLIYSHDVTCNRSIVCWMQAYSFFIPSANILMLKLDCLLEYIIDQTICPLSLQNVFWEQV